MCHVQKSIEEVFLLCASHQSRLSGEHKKILTLKRLRMADARWVISDNRQSTDENGDNVRILSSFDALG